MGTTFHVGLRRIIDDSYSIQIGEGLFTTLINDLKNGLAKNIEKYAIITDSKVKEIYGDNLYQLMKSNGFKCDLFVVPNGEKYKTRQTKENIEDELLQKGYGRDSCIIALGGGMISDLAGFVASTFCRGISYINYSTTLLSAADASVGGKTAVNTQVATNLIGSFHQPLKVYIDLHTWNSLHIREFRSGLAETIKHACIADYAFFEYLEKNSDKIINNNALVLDSDVCKHIALKNCEIKYKVVEQDEKESNLRQILNLGHTAGRAIETLSNYELLHGEAVVIGLVFQAKLAQRMGYITEHDVSRICNLLTTIGFSIVIPANITKEQLMNKMYTDKKVRKERIRFVFMSGIGEVKQFEDGSYSQPVEERLLLETIDVMYA